MTTTHRVFDELIGKTPWKIEQHTDEEGDVISLEIHFDDLTCVDFYNEETGGPNDCRAILVDVEGELDDLIGRPLTVCEAVNQEGGTGDPRWNTWTFYRLASDQGFVTLRWGGASNGYYCEEVIAYIGKDSSSEEYEQYMAQKQHQAISQEVNVDNHENTSKRTLKL